MLATIEDILSQKLSLINAARDLVNSDLTENDMFSILGDLVLKVSHAQMGTLFLYDEKNELKIKASWNLHSYSLSEKFSEFEKNFPDVFQYVYYEADTLLLDYVKTTKKVTILSNFSVPDILNNSEEIDIVIPELLFIPLKNKEQTLGYLCVIRRTHNPVPFNPLDIQSLETVSALAAQAIENNRLYEQTLKEKFLQQELILAHKIQEGLLPQSIPEYSNFEIGAFSQPARMVGGDYYDFFTLDKENNQFFGVNITDIVGKGIPAALIMALFKGILQSSVKNNLSASEVFNSINDLIYQNNLVKNFIPGVYCIFDNESKKMTYTNAGHEIPLIYYHEKDEFKEMNLGGFPLGGFSDVEYEEESIQLNKDDFVILFTDGAPEAYNTSKQPFGLEEMKNLIRQNKSLSAQGLVDKLKEKILLYSQGVKQHDDITIVIIKTK